jgi:hypothetical protein
MKPLYFLLLVICSGCALFGDYRRQYFDTGKGAAIELRVPKGYKHKSVTTDSAGNRTLQYTYPYDQQLYFSTDTSLSFFIDTAQHIPRPHLQGGRFYKGVLNGPLFWREVYSQGLKYGYRNANRDEEPLFDSSLNGVRVK